MADRHLTSNSTKGSRHPVGSTRPAPTLDDLRQLAASSGGSAGVSSFNARTGAVSLISGDVTSALGFTPTSVAGLTGAQSVAAFKTGLGLVKADVGLGSVDNTADSAKDVLSASKLTTSRTINGVAFDGTGNITISAVDSTARVPTTRTLSTTAPLIGGGDLSADRTLAISAATSGAAGSMSAADKAKLDGISNTLTADLAAKAPLANPQFTGVTYYQQSAPTAKNATATLTIADLLTLIITSTSTTAVSLTLPTGTLTDAGILSGALPVNEAFEWYLINLGSSSGAVTLLAGTGHTLVGNVVTAIGTSSRWLTRKTATNTFVTYRIA